MKLVPNLSIVVVDTDKAGLQLAKQKGLNTLYVPLLLNYRLKIIDLIVFLVLI